MTTTLFCEIRGRVTTTPPDGINSIYQLVYALFSVQHRHFRRRNKDSSGILTRLPRRWRHIRVANGHRLSVLFIIQNAAPNKGPSLGLVNARVGGGHRGRDRVYVISDASTTTFVLLDNEANIFFNYSSVAFQSGCA